MHTTRYRLFTQRSTPTHTGFYTAIARFRDVLAAGGALVVLSPLIALIGLYVKASLGSPVLFRQERIGKDNAPFTILKYRTMKPATSPDQPDEERVSRTGSQLRATSLDELPSLWNVLIGDMALVGPRPLLPEYLPFYSARQLRRHEVRPGITGLAQVNGRNSLGWEERFEMDVEYVQNRSLLLDTKILLRTVGVVLSRRHVNQKGFATAASFAPSTDGATNNAGSAHARGE